MYRKLNLVFALAACLLGGFLSRYIAPTPVFAQTRTVAPKEIQAQSFVVVDDKGNIVGTFKSSFHSPDRTPTVVLQDRYGNEVWRGSGIGVRPLRQR